MKKKSDIKAEDILIEENFSGDTLLNTSDPGEDADRNDLHIAKHIYSFLAYSRNTFSNSEKEQTKNKIKQSVNKLRRKKQLKRWSVAAAILVICSIGSITYFRLHFTPDIANYAQTLHEVKPDSNTRLILQGEKEVSISQSESKISYAKNGEDIIIGTDQKVGQSVASKKTIYNTVIVPYGKRTIIVLSEGTKVWLNSGSKLIYPAVFVEDKREVFIEGEGVFDVAHIEGKPFYVSTRDFEIKVLGTVFDVSTYSDDNYSSTVLEQGKVELSYKGNKILSKERLNILPGTMAVYDPEQKKMYKQQVNPKNYISWRDGYLVFNREKLSYILKKLSRYYNVEILLQNTQLNNETFSGNLDLKNTPEEVLNVIANTTPFIFRNENEKIVINPK